MNALYSYIVVFVATAVIFTPSSSFAHGDGRVSIEAENQTSLSASKNVELSFQLFDENTKKSVTEFDLNTSHTKKIHLIVYDSSLNEFSHTHPIFDGQVWKSELNLTTNGSYYAWAQGVLTDGTEFSTSYRFKVVGGKPALATITLGNNRKANAGNTVIELSKQEINAGKMIMLTYTVSRNDGTQPEVTPYLGANAHVIVVSPDGDNLIHAHPMDDKNSNTGMIHVTFPVYGDYRVWIQIIDEGVLKVVPLSVTVKK